MRKRPTEPFKVYQDPATFVTNDEKNAPPPDWREGNRTRMRPIPDEPATLPESLPAQAEQTQQQLRQDANEAWSIFRLFGKKK